MCCVGEEEEGVADLEAFVVGWVAELGVCEEWVEDAEVGVSEGGWAGGETGCGWRGGFWYVVGREVEEVADQYVY